ncbi:MAG: hypothetical protein JXR10_05745 [Cyclobacteriaceae bacterium]
MKGKIIFEEEQMFRYTWSYWLLVACTAPIVIGACVGIYQQIILDSPFGDNPMSDGTLIIVSVLTCSLLLSILCLFHFMKLKVTIDQSNIHYSFFPFINCTKTIHFQDIESAEVITYNPIWDYGGWGYRWHPTNGRAINVKGERGLKIIFKNGKKLLLGTQKTYDLRQAVMTLHQNWKNQHG